MNLHPMICDPIESQRCPECGTPGVVIDWPIPGLLEELACPACEPQLCERAS